jgi:hypothetical protein
MMPEYNRDVRKLALIAVLSLLAACKNIQNKDAVQLGLNDYLKARQATTGLNMDSMKVEITSLVFSPDGAQAQTTVKFTPKQGGDGMGMTMPYILDKKDNKWVVRAHAEGENPHGGPPVGAPGANPHGGAAMPPLPPLPDKQPSPDKQ